MLGKEGLVEVFTGTAFGTNGQLGVKDDLVRGEAGIVIATLESEQTTQYIIARGDTWGNGYGKAAVLLAFVNIQRNID